MESQEMTIGVFYDGGFFYHVSKYYLEDSDWKSRICIQGFHELLREEIGRQIEADPKFCEIEAHHFHGRPPKEYENGNKKFDHALEKLGVKLYRDEPLVERWCERPDGGRKYYLKEKGVDVRLALEAYKQAEHLDVVVLVTNDRDFVPLVKKLRERGVTVTVISWEYKSRDGSRMLQPAEHLMREATFRLDMADVIAEREKKGPEKIEELFRRKDAEKRVEQILTEGFKRRVRAKGIVNLWKIVRKICNKKEPKKIRKLLQKVGMKKQKAKGITERLWKAVKGESGT